MCWRHLCLEGEKRNWITIILESLLPFLKSHPYKHHLLIDWIFFYLVSSRIALQKLNYICDTIIQVNFFSFNILNSFFNILSLVDFYWTIIVKGVFWTNKTVCSTGFIVIILILNVNTPFAPKSPIHRDKNLWLDMIIAGGSRFRP